MNKQNTLLLGMLALAAVAAGCGRTITVTRYPEFWDKDLNIDSVAVVEFRDARRSEVGRDLADRLAERLVRNGTYRVYTPYQLGAIEDARDYVYLHGDADAATKIGRDFGQADAVIVGEIVEAYVDLTKDPRYKDEPIYGRNAAGERVVLGYERVEIPYHRFDATVSANATLIRVDDGRVLHSVHAEGAGYSEGDPPRLDERDVLNLAIDEAAQALLEEFAVTTMQVRVGNDALRVANEHYRGQWQEAESFDVDQELFVVVKLPDEAHLNDFVIEIAPEGAERAVATQPLTWDRSYPAEGQGWRFSTAGLADAAGGPGRFVARLISGREVVLESEFSIGVGEDGSGG